MKRIIIATLLILTLSSCLPQSQELICTTGREGIQASFVNFPENMQQNITMPLIVEFENRGAYESKQVFAWLRYGKDFFEVETDQIEITNFEGKSTFNRCTPQIDRRVYEITPYELPFATTRFERPLTIDLCYHYGNNLSTQVCVDPIPSEINALEPNCRPSDRHISGGQGSPLGITKVDAPVFITTDRSTSTGHVRIGVHLENFGDGIILAFEEENRALDSCTYQDGTYKDYVFFKAFLDNYQLDCAQFDAPGQTIENKSFMRYDPEVISTDTGSQTLKKYYLLCESDPIVLERELSMNFDVEMHYYYRESRAVESTTTIRKI